APTTLSHIVFGIGAS
ncbi:hypothetical protein CFC21_058074, partial [Triticum aestivum]